MKPARLLFTALLCATALTSAHAGSVKSTDNANGNANSNATTNSNNGQKNQGNSGGNNAPVPLPDYVKSDNCLHSTAANGNNQGACKEPLIEEVLEQPIPTPVVAPQGGGLEPMLLSLQSALGLGPDGSVPEPAAIGFLGFGAVGLAALRWKKKRQRKS